MSAMARVHARMWRYLNDEREAQILKKAMAAKVYNGIHADMNAQWCMKQLEELEG